MDDGGIGTGPLWEHGLRASGNFPERGTGDNCKEGVAHLGVVRLELALDVDDESGCDCREQTSLFPTLKLKSHEDVGANDSRK